MTVSSQLNRAEHEGDGSTVDFDYQQYFALATDLKVYVAGALVSANDYTVAGAGDPGGGTVTFDSAPANDAIIVIVNDPPLTQLSDYSANDDFPAETHEGNLDKLTLISQQLATRSARSVALSDGVVSDFDPTIPADLAAGDILFANAGLTGWDTLPSADVVAAVTAVADAQAAAAAAAIAETNAETAETNAEAAQVAAEAARDAARQAAAGLTWAFDTSTVDADPGTGELRLNHASFASVTQIFVSETDSYGANVAALLALIDDSTSATKAFLILRKQTAPANYAIFYVSSTITDAGVYDKIPVTHIASTGSFSAADVLTLMVWRVGDKGDTGAGSGDLLAANNLSELTATAGTARTNLGFSANGSTLVTQTFANMRVSLDLEAGTDFYSIAAADSAISTAITNHNAAGDPHTQYRLESAYSANGLTLIGHTFAQMRADLDLEAGTDFEAFASALATGVIEVYIPASAMTTRTTNGAPSGTVESTTNKVMQNTKDFDQTTQEFVQFTWFPPKSWNLGTVTFIPVCIPAGSSGGWVFGMAGVAISNDDVIDAAFGTAQTSTDTFLANTDVHVGPASAAITIAGTPAAADFVVFQINRTVSDGNDTHNGDVKLLGIKLRYTINAKNDT